ncbi:MAG: hypothetical protein UY97_C0017G0016 [Parcubacteria group bacterium GW2011_GWB1_57_6]|nr:MAG: hypothetical protein UY93_C0002G0432 [Parcubacteria group bacterium GW2011_GWA1_56_13]KKW45686.1 MAG: hypothetical protein UY97_C0017G0016 [Parcubacteria group bacterium GW2011_GWB1_57_6]
MKKLLMVLFCGGVFVALPLSASHAAQTLPQIISYQGRLTNASGDLLGSSTGTTYYFKFSVWTTSNIATGSRTWPAAAPTAVSATVRQGVFTVNIGDTDNGYPDALSLDFSNGNSLYLQVEVSSDNASWETLSPRQQITSSLFSLLSGAVSGTGQSSFGTTTPISGSMVSIEATSTAATPLSLRGIASQVANLFQVQNSAGTNLFVIDNSGNTGIGTSTATRKFNVFDANSYAQFRVSQASDVYGELYAVPGTGDLEISSTGGNIRQNNENLWVCSGGGCGVTEPGTKGNVVVENGVIFGNSFTFKQIDASTTVMYDTTDNPIFEFDEGE